MPRIADATLHDRILEATHRLLHKKGLDALTIRAVATAAGTTTPTIYERFATKEALVLAVADQIRSKVVAGIITKRTISEAVKAYLAFAIESPHDYKLMFDAGWPGLFENLKEQPGMIWTRQKLAEMHGGDPDDYADVADCLWIQLHGAANFIAADPKHPFNRRFYASCVHSCKVIASEAKRFRLPPTKA